MKASHFPKYFVPPALITLVILIGALLPFRAEANYPGIAPLQADSSTSLARGRALLKQGHADQALGLLQTALKDFTAANNVRGIAAAEDALGDLYLVQGQYRVALDHYQKAYQAFASGRGSDAANQAAANSAAGMTGSATAAAATQTAGTAAADNGFNANLMLD